MRVQHNAMALNSYNNYSRNTSAISKNLEKLSSGYKINRAGDDAAGLAISEKMRAQITGLETAQKNANDGISLIQTAEGALTEVHSMLNRMLELSDQSANGTYDNEVDRANLQKEFDSLKSEIDRIADSVNFNGVKLLDGSMSTTSAAKSLDVSGATGLLGGTSLVTTNATKGTGTIDLSGEVFDGTNGTFNFVYTDSDGVSKSISVDFASVAGDAKNTANNIMSSLTADSTFSNLFDIVSDGNGNLTITAKEAGASAQAATAGGGGGTPATPKTAGVAVATKYAIQNAGINDTTTKDITSTAGEDSTITLDGTYQAGDRVTIDGVVYNFAESADGSDGKTFSDKESLIAALNKNGLSLAEGNTGIYTAKKGGSALTLQIGDTAESFNQMRVDIKDMHVKALGLENFSIATQAAAQMSVDNIKDAINSVSSNRGTLGALQNRLDHTINNLSVMTENISNAESTIRDVDVAKEMTEYTKNNILLQSAQAMLAQANQIPQGVLQLLN